MKISHQVNHLFKSKTTMELVLNLEELLHLPWSKKIFQEDVCPFGVTLCFRFFKKSVKSFNKFTNILFWYSLKRIPSCHTLSKDFDICRKTLLTPRPASNDSYISWVIDFDWLICESPGLKPNCLDGTILFS